MENLKGEVQMKRSTILFISMFYLACLFSMSLFVGCGDTEDTEKVLSPTSNTLSDDLDKPWRWEKLKDEDWEKLKDKDEDWVRLTDEEVEELINLDIPKRWGFETKDKALFEKYYHATLFQKFGDIPQVRYIVEFDRQWQGGLLTLELAEQMAAYQEAMYFLFPSAVNKRSLEEAIKPVEEKRERRFMEQLRREDPETWIKYQRAALIDRHGNIPEVDTIADFLRKLELNLPRTDKECHAYFEVYDALYDDMNTASSYEFYALLEALYQIRPFVKDPPSPTLEKYREARAKGIPFYDIEWDDE